MQPDLKSIAISVMDQNLGRQGSKCSAFPPPKRAQHKLVNSKHIPIQTHLDSASICYASEPQLQLQPGLPNLPAANMQLYRHYPRATGQDRTAPSTWCGTKQSARHVAR